MPEGKGISWLVCTGESKAYLRECDVALALGDGSTAGTSLEIISVSLTLRHLCHENVQMIDNQMYMLNSTKTLSVHR